MRSERRRDPVGRRERSDARAERALGGRPRTRPVAAALLLGAALGGAAAGTAAPASAQIAWDAPLLVHPHAPHGWSLALIEPHPGNDVGILAAWRTAATPVGFGVRAGFGEDVQGDAALFGGVDASGRLARRGDDVPFDLVWVAGGGLGLSDAVVVSLPAGVVAGWSVPAGDVRLLPYVGPRAVLDVRIGGEGPGDDDVELGATLDAGLDVLLPRGWVARLGLSLGDRDAVAVGVTLPAAGRR